MSSNPFLRLIRRGENWVSPCLAVVGLVTLTGCELAGSQQPAGAAQAAPVVSAARAGNSAANTRPSPAPAPAEVSIPAGTVLRVRLDHAVTAGVNRPGDRIRATLDEPVQVDGKILLPKGSELQGMVKESEKSGRLRGRAVLSLALDSVRAHGQVYKIATGTYRRVSGSHRRRNAVLMGGGSGTGALIGGLAGGGMGALIGAGAGAAAGTVGAAATGKRGIHIPAESVINFRLTAPLRIRA